MDRLKEFWDKEVSKEHKHFVSEMSQEKKNRQVDSFVYNVLDRFDNKSDITALDWGCGGGLLSNEMTRAFKKVYVTDISDESIKEAIKYCQGSADGIINPYNGHDWNKFGIDLLVCYAVIWHFPGLDFFKKTLDIWTNKLKPKHIAIQIKEIDTDSECASIETAGYYKNGYLGGLLLRKDKVVSMFESNGYTMVYHNVGETQQGVKLGYYLFTKKTSFNKGSMGQHCKVIYDENFKCGKGSTYNDYFFCNARGGVTIGQNTLIGPNVTILSTNHVIKNIDIEQNANDNNSWCKGDSSKRVIFDPVTIGSDVWIGAGVIILSGSNIPDKCVIGAGCIITKSNSKGLKPGYIVVPDTKLRVLNTRANIE